MEKVTAENSALKGSLENNDKEDVLQKDRKWRKNIMSAEE